MKLVYGVKDRPTFGKLIIFAFQQLLAIMAATIAVPAIVGNGMTASAALFGAGAGTLIYQLFTKFRSPVFLGSSFAFIGSMSAAFAGAASMSSKSLGYLGLLIGALLAGLVYVVIALIVRFVGTEWVNKLMPPVIIGPTVAVIGLSDRRLGEKTAAIIEIKDGMECTMEEIEEFCLDLPRYKRPKEIIFAEIPRNATGKIEKPKLRKMYGADNLVAKENMA